MQAGGQIYRNSNPTRSSPTPTSEKDWVVRPLPHIVSSAWRYFQIKAAPGTFFFKKLPWHFAFCLHTAPSDFPVKIYRHARDPTGVSGSNSKLPGYIWFSIYIVSVPTCPVTLTSPLETTQLRPQDVSKHVSTYSHAYSRRSMLICLHHDYRL
jgi:hypothetical protein